MTTKMCRSGIVALGIAGALLLAEGSVLADSTPKSGQFDQVETVTTPLVSLKSTSHVTFKGDEFRIEGTDLSPDHNYALNDTIDDGQSYYLYYPDASTALRAPITEKPESTLDTLRDQTEAKLQGAAKTGETSVNGFDCDVYSQSLPGGSKVQLYQSKDPRFPYIVKTLLTNPGQGVTRTYEIQNVKLDAAVNDSLFTLPKGTKIVEQPAGAAEPSSAGGGSAPANSGASGPTDTK